MEAGPRGIGGLRYIEDFVVLVFLRGLCIDVIRIALLSLMANSVFFLLRNVIFLLCISIQLSVV